MNKRTKPALLAFALCAAIFLVAACAQQVSSPNAPAPSSPQSNTPRTEPTLKPLNGEASAKNFYLIVDGSGSMGEAGCRGNFDNRMEAAKWAVKEFVVRVVPADVSLGLYAFDHKGAKQRVSLGKGNRDLILQEADSLDAGGGTPLSESIEFATNVLQGHKAQGMGYEFYIVVVTDGKANVESGVRAALKAEIPIITIGFCLPSGHPLADPQYSLAHRDVQNPDQLFEALKETQAELPEYDSK